MPDRPSFVVGMGQIVLALEVELEHDQIDVTIAIEELRQTIEERGRSRVSLRSRSCGQQEHRKRPVIAPCSQTFLSLELLPFLLSCLPAFLPSYLPAFLLSCPSCCS